MNNVAHGLKTEIDAHLRVTWLIAVGTALILSLPVALARDSAPQAMTAAVIGAGIVPIIMYVRSLIVARRKAATTPDSSGTLEKFDATFCNFADAEELAVVELTFREGARPKSGAKQLELGFEFETRNPTKERFRIFQTAAGKQLIALDCERFSAMLTSEAIESFDKSFDKSLETTLLRLSGSAIAKDHLYVLTNETARDLLKSDVRGNLVAYLSRTNDLLIKRVLADLRTYKPTLQASAKASASSSAARGRG
jgi:hypothetical protein